MPEQSSPLTPIPLMQLTAGLWASQALVGAHDLNTFAKLSASKGMTITEFAHSCGIQERPAELLLTACASLGLLERREDQYVNSALAEAFLVPGQPYYFGGWVEMLARREYPGWMRIGEALRRNRPTTWDPDTQSSLFDGAVAEVGALVCELICTPSAAGTVAQKANTWKFQATGMPDWSAAAVASKLSPFDVWIGCNSVMTAWTPPIVSAPPSTRCPDGQFARKGAFVARVLTGDDAGTACTVLPGRLLAVADGAATACVARTVKPRATAGAHFSIARVVEAPTGAPLLHVPSSESFAACIHDALLSSCLAGLNGRNSYRL